MRYLGNSFGGRSLSIPTLEPVRLFGNEPVRDGVEGVSKALELYDKLPMEGQDTLGVPLEVIFRHIFGG